MNTHSCSFLSRLTLPGLMLLLMTAGTLSADTFNINVDFGGGLTGSGSFNTDGTCDPCTAGAGQQLTNFTFTVDDDTLNEAEAVANALEYHRAANTLTAHGGLLGGDQAPDRLDFFPGTPGTTGILFVDVDDAPTGEVSATGTISAVPEPGSVVLLVTALAVAVFTARCKLSIRPPN